MGAPPSADYASWRAAFPTTDDAYRACERPDWLVRLAAESIPVNRILRALASFLRATAFGSMRGALSLAWPFSSPLEVALAWAGSADPLASKLRAVKLVLGAALLLVPFAVAIDLVWLSSLSRLARALVLQGGFAIATLVIAVALDGARRAHSRRALATMTDARALDTVVSTLADLGARRPPDRLRLETATVRALLAGPRR